MDAFSISQLPILNILCCLLSTKCTATLLKDRLNGEYYKILEEITKPFVKKHSAFIEQEQNQNSKFLLNKFGLFVSLTIKVYLFVGQDLFVCWLKSKLENFDFRYLPFTHPPTHIFDKKKSKF